MIKTYIVYYVFALFILNVYSKSSVAQNVVLQWRKQMGGLGANRATAIATDQWGNSYITGNFEDTIDANTGGTAVRLIARGSSDIIVSKIDPEGNLIWIKQLGGQDYDLSLALAIDQQGNIYTAGQFSGTADFDPGTGSRDTFFLTTAPGGSDVFISKLDSSGNFVWARQMHAGDFAATANAITVDPTGNICITGYFSDTLRFGKDTDPLVCSGGSWDNDVFVARLNNAGTVLWAKQMGGMGLDYGNGIATDSYGNVYTIGNFSGQADFDPGPSFYTLTASGGSSIFITKSDSNGIFSWARMIDGTSYSYANAITISRLDDNVYVTGSFSGTVYADPYGANIRLSSSGDYDNDIFISKQDTSGQFIWAKHMGGTAYDEGNAVTTDLSGNVYLTGSFSDSAVFNPGVPSGSLTAKGKNDIFITKLHQNGHLLWVKQLGGEEAEQGKGISTDHHGSIYSTGFFTGTVDFDPGSGSALLTAMGQRGWQGVPPDMYVHKMICTDTTSSLIHAESCPPGYTFENAYYTQSGRYTHITTNTAGCDSTIILDLVIHELIHPVIMVNDFVLKTSEPYVSYQWLLNGRTIPGATGRTYTVTENGDYSVVVENEYGCKDTSDTYKVTNVNGNNIREQSTIAGAIWIYPNPVADKVFIHSPIEINITLTGIEGKILRQVKAAGSLSVNDLPGGIYLLCITDKEGRFIKVEKLVKDK